MKNKIKGVICVVCGLACLYLLVCWIDIASHNNSSQKYGKWNIIYILFNKQEETVEEEPTTTEQVVEVTTEQITTEVTTTEQTTVTTTEVTTETVTEEITTEEVITTEYLAERAIEATTETVEAITEEDVAVATGTDADVDEDAVWLLAHLINGEAGAGWCCDTTRYYVGSVVLNRINHPEFPDTLYEVIYQSGQYACTWDGNFSLEPSDRCWEIARDLLANGSVLPADVVFQANFTQGSGVYDYMDGVYFCYR